ncbi:dihydroneopterin aldolase [Candidatus Woesearchaeota archaeon]|nr:dihydroneopterin aldolase [Candidatus Woesearchaeota archaeon]
MIDDMIFIRGILISASVGVTQKELRVKQKIIVDIELVKDISKASETDDLQHTINYVDVTHDIKNLVYGKEYKLIETLTEDVAKYVLKKYNPEAVTVKVHKPEIASMKLGIRDLGIKITRKRG